MSAYIKVINELIAREVEEEVVDSIRSIYYKEYKEKSIEEKIDCINQLLIEGYNVNYISKIFFGVSESTIRKELSRHGYYRVWQFIHKEIDFVEEA